MPSNFRRCRTSLTEGGCGRSELRLSGPCVSTINQLNQAKIPAFAINILPDTEGMKQQNVTLVQGVQTDQREGGKLIGQQLLKDIGENGTATVGIVGEPTSIAANARDEGFKEAVASNKNIKFVALVNGKVEETTSLKVTTEMLQGRPEINVVYSDTEPSALGHWRQSSNWGSVTK